MRRGCPKSTNNLALRQATFGDPFLRFQCQFVKQEISEVIGVLVVFQNLLQMNRSRLSRRQFIRQSLAPQFFVDKHARDRVLRRGRWPRFDVREGILPGGCSNLENPLLVIAFYRPNLHSSPSAISFVIISRTLFGACPSSLSGCRDPTSPQVFHPGTHAHVAANDPLSTKQRRTRRGGVYPFTQMLPRAVTSVKLIKLASIQFLAQITHR